MSWSYASPLKVITWCSHTIRSVWRENWSCAPRDGVHITCRKSLCFLCPNPYPFPTGFSENTRVYAPGFGTIAAKMLRINPDPKKKARDIFCGRSGYRLGFIRGPLGISLGIHPVAAREIAWDFSGGHSGYRLGFIRGPLGILLRDFCQRALPNREAFSEKLGQTQPIEHPTRCISQCAQPTSIPLFDRSFAT